MLLPRKNIPEFMDDESMNSYTMKKIEVEIWNKAMDVAQAELDKIMIEFCPDEMTKEQWQEYDNHQMQSGIGDILC